MHKQVVVLLFGFCLAIGQLHAQDSKTFVGGPVDNITLLRSANNACFICGRTPKDFLSAQGILLDEMKARLEKAQLQAAGFAGQTSKQAAEILSGIAEKNKGVLDLPLRTIRNDQDSFSKMVPQLQVVLDYASKEGISNQTPLSQVLDAMQSGKSKGGASADAGISDARIDIAIFSDLSEMSVSESFVRIDVRMSDLLQINANLAESKTDYDKWIAANKTAIQDIRTTYALDAAQGRSKLLALLDKSNSVVPVSLQQTLRTGMIYQLIGAPNATLRITLCPVCRELFEYLNGRIHVLYSNKR